MSALPPVFEVRVQLLSDWIVGTGEGRVGDVDATVRRDADGLPFVPAKTLTGVWRDACEQVAGWLGTAGWQDNPWQAWVDWIFGSQPDARGDRVAGAHRAPQPAALALSPARFPPTVRAACRNRPALQAAAVFLRPGVAVDNETGVARDDMLRLEERARPGTLEAMASFAIPGGADLPEAAELLLRAGAAAVDGLGGKRNRGAGCCWLVLPGMTSPPAGQTTSAAARPADARLAELAANTALLDGPSPPPGYDRPAVRLVIPGTRPDQAAPAGVAGQDHGGAGRTVHRITWEVITPLVAQHRVLGNVVLSRDSVPGSMMFPAILARLDRAVGPQDLVVGDARPAPITGQAVVPGLPAPMTWYRPKDRHLHDVVNAAIRRPDPHERRKAIRTGHIAPASAGSWYLVNPEMSVSAHAVVDDDAGRPTSDRGGVFTYVGLAPGTALVSDIVLPADVHPSLAVGDRLHLGRSRKDDFGEVEVQDVRVVPAPQAAALPAPGTPGQPAGARVRVWCVSDVLLRDAWGAPDPSPEALSAELSRQLGAPVSVVPGAHGAPVLQAYRAARRDSFHTRWGRPRPSLVGLAAGSVITVRVDGAVGADALTAVQRDGIGERTAEGFGQVRVDAPEVAVVAPRVEFAASGGPVPLDGTDAAGLPPAPDILERAAVEAEIGRQVAALVVGGSGRIVPGAEGVSSRSQWGSLREQLPRLKTEGGREAVARWFDQTRDVRQRRAVWGEGALDALKRLVTDHAAVWEELGLGGNALGEFVLAPDRADAVRVSLWHHAVSVLITEISRDATRELQARSEAGEGQQ